MRKYLICTYVPYVDVDSDTRTVCSLFSIPLANLNNFWASTLDLTVICFALPPSIEMLRTPPLGRANAHNFNSVPLKVNEKEAPCVFEVMYPFEPKVNE